jgi:inner membrane protein
MQRMSHIIFALIIFGLFMGLLHLSPITAVFALLGALAPDADLPLGHRKLLHNVWALGIMLIIFWHFGFTNWSVLTAFSLGFISHLIADSLTHHGIMPLWPIQKPKFNGPITTGSIGEYVVIAGLLLAVYFFGWVIG